MIFMSYNSLNFLNIDQLFSKEELSIRDSVRSFVNNEVLGLTQAHNRNETFPKELIKKFAKLGLLGTNIKGYGCPGLGDVCYGLAMQEIERVDSGLRSFCSVQGSLVMYPIWAFGDEDQKNKYLPKLASGDYIGCFGLTEPDAGSNPGSMQTKAINVDGGYKLTGNKMWITNGCISDIAIIWAKLDNVVRGFIVETNSPGFSTTTMKGKLSLRMSVTSELHLQDCFIPESQILPKVQGLKGPLSCLTQARFGITWGVLGAANACYDTALNYSKTRIIFDKPLAGYQLAQAKLVKMVQEITKAQFLSLQLGRLKEAGELTPAQVSLVKMNNCKMALEIAREARDMLGANGVIDEYPIITHMLNLESVNTYEGTEDIHRLVIGMNVTGHSAIK